MFLIYCYMRNNTEAGRQFDTRDENTSLVWPQRINKQRILDFPPSLILNHRWTFLLRIVNILFFFPFFLRPKNAQKLMKLYTKIKSGENVIILWVFWLADPKLHFFLITVENLTMKCKYYNLINNITILKTTSSSVLYQIIVFWSLNIKNTHKTLHKIQKC